MVAKILISQDAKIKQQAVDELLNGLKVKKGHPDLLYFEPEEKLGIAQARNIKDFLSIKPFQSESKVVVLEDASRMTVEAQNALLKTLEELPKKTTFILASSTDANFLPTVLSRCEVRYLSNQLPDVNLDIEKLINSSLEDRFALIEKCKDRDKLFKNLVAYSASHPEDVNLKAVLEAEKWAAANGNIRAILEYLMLVC